MSTTEMRFLLTAVIIIRNNLILFFLPICIFTVTYLPLTAAKSGGDLSGPTMLLSVAGNVTLFVLYPIVYGHYLDIAAGRPRRPSSEILRTDWWNYFLVSIILGAPVFLVAHIDLLPALPVNVLELLATLVSQWISIYSVPLVFFMRKRAACIVLGAKCLGGNLHFSRHLVWLTAAATIFNYAAMHLSENAGTMQRGAWGLTIIFVTMGIDLLVFITAALILQDKFFNQPNP